MANLTAADFPPGYLEENIGYQLEAFAICSIVIQIAVVALRFASRAYSKLYFGVEDVLVSLALVAALVMDAMSIFTVHWSDAGRHMVAIELSDPQKLANFPIPTLPFNTAYQIGMTFPKIAMCLMFIRIFTTTWQRRICYVLIFAMSVQAIINIILNFTQCQPLAYFWDKNILGGHCIDQNAFWRWETFPSIITDIVMLALPISSVTKIQLAWKDKLGVLLTFLFGSIGLVTAILRFAIYMSVDNLSPTSDATWEVVKEGIVALAEVTVYLIASCLPSYRSFYLTVRKTKKSQAGYNSYGWSRANRRGTGQDQEDTIGLKPYSATSRSGNFVRLDNGSDAIMSEQQGEKTPNRIMVKNEYGVRVDNV